MQQIELISLLKKAVKKFYENDNLLVCKGGMEQACVFRIGIYLNELIKNHPRFNNLNLDCEYNKSSRGNKRLRGISVRPDLIIHERKKSCNNYYYFSIDYRFVYRIYNFCNLYRTFVWRKFYNL